MKKVIALLCSLLFLCGCSQKERLQCVHCREWITGGILLDSDDTVCGECLIDKGYLICRNCGDVYDPYDCYVADFGYCEDCEEELIGICGRCDNAYLRDQLGVANDGESYLCAMCENEDLIEIIEDPNLFKFTVDDYNEAYDKGFEEGYDSGYEDGKEEGYDAGNDAGTKAGHDTGYEEGYKAGHEDGRKEGYNSGYDAGTKVASSVANSSSNTKSSNNIKTPSVSSNTSKAQSATVYITATGSKYHRSGCQYLSKSKIAISLDDAKAQGYTACSRCW